MFHIDSVRCTGCGYCINACPQKAITIDNNAAVIHQELCNQCGTCAEVCPAQAITFGDLNNFAHAVTRIVRPDPKHHGRPKNPKAFRLLERLGTNPKVYYISSRGWVRRAGDNYHSTIGNASHD